MDFLCGESANENTRQTFRGLYREGLLDDRSIEVELPEGAGGGGGGGGGGGKGGMPMEFSGNGAGPCIRFYFSPNFSSSRASLRYEAGQLQLQLKSSVFAL